MKNIQKRRSKEKIRCREKKDAQKQGGVGVWGVGGMHILKAVLEGYCQVCKNSTDKHANIALCVCVYVLAQVT